ncbi:radical SAM protein [Clostridiaceae bacterium M8S5]|nr:radical SAM protein [Clostridiaceae bacterium M8S5]
MVYDGKMLSIHLTDRCNNKCWFCVVDSPTQLREMANRKKIDRFIEAHRGQRYIAVNLHGGEPTVRKDFIEILEKIAECEYPHVILQTNARRLASKKFAERVCELGVDLFVVSIHGSDAAIHEKITQVPKSFEQAIKGIRNVKSLGAKVRTNSVVSRMNFEDFPSIMELLISLNVDHINISALHTVGAAFRHFNLVTPTYDEAMPFVRRGVELVRKSGTVLTLEGFPLCVIEGLHEHLIDWHNQQFKMLFRGVIIDNYETYMDETMRVHGEICSDCTFFRKCGGVYKEYIAIRGWDEFVALTSKGRSVQNANA